VDSVGMVGALGLDGVLVFFFSSRRRHTRLVSDWSSDVCSSDLFCRNGFALLYWKLPPLNTRESIPAKLKVMSSARWPWTPKNPRSEERRVGKEGGAWWKAGV